MSAVRLKIEIHAEIDTEDYAVPSDGRLTLSLKEDVEQALEASLPLIISNIKITKTGGVKSEEVRDYD